MKKEKAMALCITKNIIWYFEAIHALLMGIKQSDFFLWDSSIYLKYKKMQRQRENNFLGQKNLHL